MKNIIQAQNNLLSILSLVFLTDLTEQSKSFYLLINKFPISGNLKPAKEVIMIGFLNELRTKLKSFPKESQV
jgi:hypothetical protein